MEPKKSILLRISPELARDLHVWARDEMRSVNGQIEFVLKQAVIRRKGGRSAAEETSAAPASEDPESQIAPRGEKPPPPAHPEAG